MTPGDLSFLPFKLRMSIGRLTSHGWLSEDSVRGCVMASQPTAGTVTSRAVWVPTRLLH